MPQDKEFDFVIMVDRQKLMNGDKLSISVVFGNLTGKNFDQKEYPQGEHATWLRYMEREHKMDLPLQAEIQVLSPDGKLLQHGSIGGSLPRSS